MSRILWKLWHKRSWSIDFKSHAFKFSLFSWSIVFKTKGWITKHFNPNDQKIGKCNIGQCDMVWSSQASTTFFMHFSSRNQLVEITQNWLIKSSQRSRYGFYNKEFTFFVKMYGFSQSLLLQTFLWQLLVPLRYVWHSSGCLTRRPNV